ncbi:MAG: hypothetical protein C0599_09490, partial [Salinivirgaceae bacterium]
SLDPGHADLYQEWVDIKGRRVRAPGPDGQMTTIVVPTFVDNLKFFFKYQLGYMYGRYFMWNFVGRQNNIQGQGDKLNGNWQSGIPFIDDARLVPAKDLPDSLKNNPASNKYYFLPLILGLIGIFAQWKSDKRNTLVVLLFFLLTGAAIVFYLNEIPRTPRERDYAFVGSFYVFAIWMGLGALKLITLLKNNTNAKVFAIASFVVIGLLVPANMLYQNYDDHDRSGRYLARAHAVNMLNSCKKNAVMFTAADNDSYPVWYMQEVEQYRLDVLPILKTFLPTNWYIRQLETNFAQRGALETTMRGNDFLMGKNMSIPVIERRQKPASALQVVKFVKNDDKGTKVPMRDGSMRNFIPVKNLFLPVDKDNFMATADGYDFVADSLPEQIDFSLRSSSISADEIVILDIIAHNEWRRPIYFLNKSMVRSLGLEPYVHREGLLYRLLPFKTNDKSFSNARYQYDLIMNNFEWGGITDDIYLDWTNVRMFYSFGYRPMIAEVAKGLSAIGDNEKAVKLLDKSLEKVNPQKIPWSYDGHNILSAYLKAGDKEKSQALMDDLTKDIYEWFEMYKKLSPEKQEGAQMEIYRKLYLAQELLNKTRNQFPEEHQRMMKEFSEIRSMIRL